MKQKCSEFSDNRPTYYVFILSTSYESQTSSKIRGTFWVQI